MGSLKAQALSSLTLKERCFGSEAGAPGKGLAVEGAASWGPCMRSEDLGAGREKRGWGGLGWVGATGLAAPSLLHLTAVASPGLLACSPAPPTPAALQGPDLGPNLPSQPCRNTSTMTEIAQDEIYILDPGAAGGICPS